MSETTGIEWTDHTFNIAWGCLKVSPGCEHCYADTLSRRYGHHVWGPAKTTPRRAFGVKHWLEPIKWNAKAKAAGVRRRVFCSSMCDVFEDHPTIDTEREKLWPLIRATPWLDWQLLTKRPERIAANLPSDWGPSGYHNIWLGTSVESQAYVHRIDTLADVCPKGMVAFASMEPLLGAVSDAHAGFLNWMIVGGESGPGCRPMALDWARSLRDQCADASVAFFLKQLGGSNPRGHALAVLDGVRHTEMPR